MVDLELFTIEFALEHSSPSRVLFDSPWLYRLRTKFGNDREVLRYLRHRRAQLAEGWEE